MARPTFDDMDDGGESTEPEVPDTSVDYLAFSGDSLTRLTESAKPPQRKDEDDE